MGLPDGATTDDTDSIDNDLMDQDAGDVGPARTADFIREIVAEDRRTGKHGGRVRHALSARTERLPPHRPRQGHLPRLRRRGRIRRASATFASTTPTPRRRTSSTSKRSRRTSAGSDSTGPTDVLCVQLLRVCCTSTPSSSMRDGKAYVDSLTADEIREYRGTLTEPGRNSPYRDRAVDENLDLLPAHARRRVPRRQRTCCARRSTWRRPTSTCAIRRSTGSGT